ncbi:transposase [Streptomyces cyaneofuscatus]|uniref:transposase n=1 Tax=Streptomyces cyaneofuscatus TaxID=66883 RepID=UPI0036509008
MVHQAVRAHRPTPATRQQMPRSPSYTVPSTTLRGRTVTAVAREFGISSKSLCGWYRRAKADRGEGAPVELTSAECDELRRLRKENREQQQTIEFLKIATLESTG